MSQERSPHYAILRIGRMKSFAALRNCCAHNLRKVPVENSNPLGPVPEDLLGGGSTDFVADAQSRLDRLGIIPDQRKGKVLAAEMVMTASPGWFERASDEQKEGWKAAAVAFAHERFGDGLLSVVLHADEDTPHIHAVALPIVLKQLRPRGRPPINPAARAAREAAFAARQPLWALDYDAMFGGPRGVMSALQDDYHACVAHLGMARGISRARRQDAPVYRSPRAFLAELRVREAEVALDEARSAERERAVAASEWRVWSDGRAARAAVAVATVDRLLAARERDEAAALGARVADALGYGAELLTDGRLRNPRKVDGVRTFDVIGPDADAAAARLAPAREILCRLVEQWDAIGAAHEAAFHRRELEAREREGTARADLEVREREVAEREASVKRLAAEVEEAGLALRAERATLRDRVVRRENELLAREAATAEREKATKARELGVLAWLEGDLYLNDDGAQRWRKGVDLELVREVASAGRPLARWLARIDGEQEYIAKTQIERRVRAGLVKLERPSTPEERRAAVEALLTPADYREVLRHPSRIERNAEALHGRHHQRRWHETGRGSHDRDDGR